MMKKHQCLEPGCSGPRFRRRYELERHKKSKHHHLPEIGDRQFYRCAEGSCQNKQLWARSDHLRQHAKRCHPHVNVEQLIHESALDHARAHPASQENSVAPKRNLHVPSCRSWISIENPISQELCTGASPDCMEATFEPTAYRLDAGCSWQDIAIATDNSLDHPQGLQYRPQQDLSTLHLSALTNRILSFYRRMQEYKRHGLSSIPVPKQVHSKLFQPRPVRAVKHTPSVLQSQVHPDHQMMDDAPDGFSLQHPPAMSSITKQRAASAPPILDYPIERPNTQHAGSSFAAGVSSRTVYGYGDGDHASRGYSQSWNYGASAYNAGFTNQGNVPYQSNAGNNGPYVSRDNSNPGSPPEEEEGDFPCVFHNFGNSPDPTRHCHKRQKFISKLYKHHQARAHPGGPFFYCRKCFRRDFRSEQEAVTHKQQNTCQFLCVAEQCPNFDRQPTSDHPCIGHPAWYNTPQSIWNKLYRLGRNLPSRAPVPVITHRPAAQSLQQSRLSVPAIPRPRQALSRSVSAAPSMTRSTSTASGSAPGYMPYAYAGMRDVDPLPDLAGSPLSNLDRQSTISASSEDSLDGLARTMWLQVNLPRPEWSVETFGWYKGVMEELAGFTPPGRSTMLLTLIESYRLIIDDPNGRGIMKWTQVSALTRATLRLPVPTMCPWIQEPSPGLALPLSTLNPATTFNNSFGFSQASLFSGSLNNNNIGYVIGNSHESPRMQNNNQLDDVQSIISQTRGTASSVYELVRAPTTGSHLSPSRHNPFAGPSVASGPSDQAYVSGPGSAQDSYGNGKASSEPYGQSHRSFQG